MKYLTAFGSYPLFRLTIYLVSGIFLSDIFFRGNLPVIVFGIALWILLAGVFINLNRQEYSSRWLFGSMVFLFLLFLGALLVQHKWEQVVYDWPSERTLYQGVITDPPREKAKTWLCKLHVEAKVFRGQFIPVDRTLLVYIVKDSLTGKLQCGDRLQFYTRVSRPLQSEIPGEFDYAVYLFRQQVSGTAVVFPGYWRLAGGREPLNFRQQAGIWREKVLSCYRRWGFSGDEFAVLSALTVGYKEELSEELQKSYQLAGASHILALSGMHVTILWSLFGWLTWLMNKRCWLRWIKCLLILLLLAGFAFFTGLSASVVRAVVMCGLMTVTQIVEKKGFSLNALFTTAFFMLLYNPFYLFDAGFQLSFLAVVSILTIHPVLFHCWEIRRPVLRYIWKVITVSLAAQLGTAPLVIYYFSYFPVHFLLANLIVTPLAFLIIYGTVAVCLFSVCGIFHVWLVKGMDCLLWLLNHSMQWIESLPYARSGHIHFSVIQVCLLYVLLSLLLVYRLHRSCKLLIAMLLVVHIFIGMDIYRTRFQKEKPLLLLARSQVKVTPQAGIWQHDSIYYCEGVTVCLLADDRWRNKRADVLLNVDYIYLCKGYRGTIASLQDKFHINTVILDASLSEYRANSLKEECEYLGLEYIDISEKGSFRILL